MDTYSLMLYLTPGVHRIYPSLRLESRIGCGFYPICSEKSMVATDGLKWNVGELSKEPHEFTEINFKKLISTSNEIVAETVTIETSDPLLWSTTLNDHT